MNRPDISHLTEGLIELTRGYASTPRAIVTEERYKLVEGGVLTEFTFDTEAIREPLIEHVGHLPVIAAYLHPHIEHTDRVDLGRVLTMLAVHDIGETEVGDVLSYKKTQAHEAVEREAARKLLGKPLFSYWEEMEAFETLDAKFAKAMDSLAPLLHELMLPKVTLERFKYYGFDLEKIIARKQAHFAWDSVLRGVFAYGVEKYKEMGA